MRKYGLIGKSLTHSYSKKYFTDKFKKEYISDALYELFQLNNINDLPELVLKEKDILGLNVTIPYKEDVIPLLDELDDEAQQVNAVNTIKIERNASHLWMKGYNTDIIGFRESLKPLLNEKHTKALIFGTGGSSKAVAHVLEQLSINYLFVSRSKSGMNIISYGLLSQELLESHLLVINCTPIGTFPLVEETIPVKAEWMSPEHLVYDLVYNPEETKLLKMAKQAGAGCQNGLLMLSKQAEASWAIWNE